MFKEDELDELHTTLEKNWMNRVGMADGFKETWQVVQDASKYSFNASHSLSYAYDSLYGAYLKSHYPLEYYTCALNLYEGDIERTPRLIGEMDHFDIKLKQPKFRYSKAEYFMDKETNSIYKGIGSIKFLNKQVSDHLYSLRDNTYERFTDLLNDIQGYINSRQLEILIILDFFEEFGNTHKLLEIVRAYNTICTKKTYKHDNEYIEHILPYAAKVTEKTVRDVDTLKVMYGIENDIKNEHIPIQERVAAHFEYMGNCTLKDESYDGRKCVVTSVDTKYSPKIVAYNIMTGKSKEFKIGKKIFKDNPKQPFDTITILNVKSKPKKKMVDGRWVQLEDMDFWIEVYE